MNSQDIVKDIDKEALKARILELRRGGKTYRAIGELVGVSYKTVENYLHEILEEIQPDPKKVNQYRALELERMNRILDVLETRVANGEVAALDRVLKVNARIAAMLGLDITKHEVDLGENTLQAIDPDKAREAIIKALSDKFIGNNGSGQEPTG